MPALDVSSQKTATLRHHHALNTRPRTVQDPAFTSGDPFFDAHDLIQVKYEMLRRVREDGQSVSRASEAFGFSRPSFYQALGAFRDGGLPGLIPQRPGPRRAHKLSERVVDALEAALVEQPTLSSAAMVALLHERFNLTVHPRSVERALDRRRKGGLQATA